MTGERASATTRNWVCPRHENSSLESCRDAGCAEARLAGAAPELLAALAVLVEAYDNPEPLMPFAAYIRHARAVIARARPAIREDREPATTQEKPR